MIRSVFTDQRLFCNLSKFGRQFLHAQKRLPIPKRPVLPLDPENTPNHTLPSNSAGKIIKMAIKSEPLELCS